MLTTHPLIKPQWLLPLPRGGDKEEDEVAASIGAVRWADKRADKNFCPVVSKQFHINLKYRSDTCIQGVQPLLCKEYV